MKVTTRIHLDAALQNVKNVAFFTFLQVLIARLGASNFEIALSNSLPGIFCALSLAIITRQLPVTRQTFLVSGYIRQFAFLCMALSVLMPNPIPYLLFFWCVNAVAVMVGSAQQPAILRRCIEPSAFPAIFSRNKIIGIVIMTSGSILIGSSLDATDAYFPMNYSVSMLIGCLATFTGMSLIASLAPNEKTKFQFKWVKPFRECDRTIWWMALNNAGIQMVAPLFTIYHVKHLGLSNTQIAYFVVTAGIVSAVSLPFIRRLMERIGIRKVYGFAIISMALVLLPYGIVKQFWLLILMQAWIGVMLAVNEVSSNSLMMNEASKHKREMDYFSDFQLVMNVGNAIGPLIAVALLSVLPLWACFLIISVIRIVLYGSTRLTPQHEMTHTEQLSGTASQKEKPLPT